MKSVLFSRPASRRDPRARALDALSILVLATLLASPAAAAPPDPGPTVGTNLTWLRPNTGEWPFVDAFKTSLPWVAGQWFGCFGCPEAGTLDLDADGWIRSLDPTVGNGGQVAHALLFLQAVDMYPAGEYTVLYDGQGNLDYGGSATLVSSAPGHDVLSVDPSHPEPLAITLLRTDPSDPLRDIRVIMPGGVCSNDPFAACDADADCGAGTCRAFVDNYGPQLFHPTFLDNARRFSVLRLMDWLETNDAAFTDFSQLPTLTSAHWPVAPPEIMAELANRLSADLWLSVPHLADDTFVQQLAAAVHSRLDSARKVYVQYSGEVWNPDFQQFEDVTRLGCQAFPALGCDQDANPGNGIVCEGHPWQQWSADCETARRRFDSRRSVEVWDLFAGVFGGTGRLVRVLGSQGGNTGLHDELLAFENAYRKTDALATGAYFGWELGGDPAVAGWDLNELFDVLEQQAVPEAVELMRDDADFLAGSPLYSSIPLVLYEGGQGLVTWGAVEADPALDQAVGALYDAANRDDRMEALYAQLLDGWVADGGGNLFLHYVNVHATRPWGRYGALEHQDQPHCDSPKYRALMGFIDGTTCP